MNYYFDIEVDKYQFYGGQPRGLENISTCQHLIFPHLGLY